MTIIVKLDTHFTSKSEFDLGSISGLVFIVLIGAHFVSLTMKITITCSLHSLIKKPYGGMFVTDATFLELGKTRMNGLDGLLSLGMVKLSENFLVNWDSQLRCIVFGKNGIHGSLQVYLEIQIWSLIKSKGSFATSSI
jgi:hypothetical protein